ncbi:hypothetical protein PCE1_001078 [Barthelona sp. PCE]
MGIFDYIAGEPEDPSFMDEVSGMFKMSMKTRMKAFGICCIVAFVCFILCCLNFLNPSGFAFPFTILNLSLLLSTGFLIGPMKQLKNMLKPKRAVCALTFIGSMVLTLMAVYKWESFLLCLIFVIIQGCAFIYYVGSYIPFCRSCLKGTAKSVIGV